MIIIQRLVAKAQKGSDKAFLKLFKEYEEDIYRTAYVYVKNQHDALDIVQETAYKAFKNINSLKNPNYVKSWIIKIAVSCSIDLIRKNKKVVQLHPDHEQFIGTEDHNIPLSITLNNILEDLNETEKKVILLKYYFGYTFHEISELEDLPLGTVKSVVYRALAKLRNQVRRDDMYEQ
ncbi:sigma-70 family RNA polymerase sigma factor [Aquibacillus saliphilus]|uniref:sigma-70 family RNA polymerase sigma factor n=1 Tax=Aquibacillus saliphilus TaxID=1909422 RepID=UPI001CF03A83